jgi:hypothetical protein
MSDFSEKAFERYAELRFRKPIRDSSPVQGLCYVPLGKGEEGQWCISILDWLRERPEGRAVW